MHVDQARFRVIRSLSAARATQAGIGIAVSAVFAWLALRGVHTGQVTAALSRAQWRWLVPATALLLAAIAMRAVRWSKLFPARRRPAVGACFWALNIGYLANALLPFRAGELIRVIVLSRETGTSKAQGLFTVVLERVFDLVSIALVMLAIAPLVPAGVTRASLLVISGCVLAATAALVAVVRSARLSRAASRVVERHGALRRRRAALESASEAFEPLRSTRAAGVVLAWSFASWVVLGLSTVYVERAFTRSLPWPSGGLALVATTYAQAIPSSAASIGVFEAAARQSLTVFGVTSAVAVAFALVYHAVSVLPTVPLGLAGLGRMGVRHVVPAAPDPVWSNTQDGVTEVSVVIPCLNEEPAVGAVRRLGLERHRSGRRDRRGDRRRQRLARPLGRDRRRPRRDRVIAEPVPATAARTWPGCAPRGAATS